MNALLAIPQALLAYYQAHEVAGLFLFLLVEEAGAPLFFPGDTLIMAAGARHGRSIASVLLVLAAAASAASLGSSLLYALVRRGGRPLLVRYGRYLHLNERRVATLEGWFHRHGAAAIVVGRLVPGLRTPTTVMAGLFDVPYRAFAPATALAAIVWALAYFFLGMLLERQWQEFVSAITGDVDAAATVLVILVLAAAALAGAVAWRRRQPAGDPGSA